MCEAPSRAHLRANRSLCRIRDRDLTNREEYASAANRRHSASARSTRPTLRDLTCETLLELPDADLDKNERPYLTTCRIGPRAPRRVVERRRREVTADGRASVGRISQRRDQHSYSTRLARSACKRALDCAMTGRSAEPRI